MTAIRKYTKQEEEEITEGAWIARMAQNDDAATTSERAENELVDHIQGFYDQAIAGGLDPYEIERHALFLICQPNHDYSLVARDRCMYRVRPDRGTHWE